MMGNAKFALLLVSLTASGHLWSAQGYSSGAPTDVCEDMLPQHGPAAQTKPSPYTLTLNRNTVGPGETVTVTIAAKDSGKFKGFMIQAVDGSTGNPVGSFTPMSPPKSGNDAKNKWKLINCPDGPAGNTATHVSAEDKSRIVLKWIAPKDLKQNFKFKYTVAKNGGEYWVAKESDSVAVGQPSSSAAKKN